MRALLATVLALAVPATAAAQAPPANPPGPVNSSPGGGPRHPAPAGSEVPRPGTLHRFWLHEGDHVRFTDEARDLHGVSATVLMSDAEGLTVLRGGRAEVVPFAHLMRLEVSRGTRHWWKGALVGTAVGLGAWAAFGNAFDDDVEDDDKVEQAAMSTAAGLVAGTLAGGLAWHPQWHTVDLGDVPLPTPPVSLRLSPTDRGARIALSVRW